MGSKNFFPNFFSNLSQIFKFYSSLPPKANSGEREYHFVPQKIDTQSTRMLISSFSLPQFRTEISSPAKWLGSDTKWLVADIKWLVGDCKKWKQKEFKTVNHCCRNYGKVAETKTKWDKKSAHHLCKKRKHNKSGTWNFLEVRKISSNFLQFDATLGWHHTSLLPHWLTQTLATQLFSSEKAPEKKFA